MLAIGKKVKVEVERKADSVNIPFLFFCLVSGAMVYRVQLGL